jgi:hypothetical protein
VASNKERDTEQRGSGNLQGEWSDGEWWNEMVFSIDTLEGK